MKKRSGFTIMELVTVIIIMGLIGGFSVKALASGRSNMEVRRVAEEIKTVIQEARALAIAPPASEFNVTNTVQIQVNAPGCKIKTIGFAGDSKCYNASRVSIDGENMDSNASPSYKFFYFTSDKINELGWIKTISNYPSDPAITVISGSIRYKLIIDEVTGIITISKV